MKTGKAGTFGYYLPAFHNIKIIKISEKMKHLTVIIVSGLLFVLTTFLGGSWGGHDSKFILIIFLYSIVSYVLLKKTNNKREQVLYTLILISFPVVILGYVYIRDLLNRQIWLSAISWPSSVSYLISIMIGWLIFSASKVAKFIIAAISISLSLWVYIYGYNYWLNYLNSGTFSGRVSEEISGFTFTDDYGNVFTNNDFDHRTVIFDFWFTGCGYCIEEMPGFEKLFKKYNKKSQVLFYSVNIPIRSDTNGYANYLVRENNFTFPLIYASDSLKKTFSLRSFPTYVILENGWKVVYRGRLVGLEKYLAKTIE